MDMLTTTRIKCYFSVESGVLSPQDELTIKSIFRNQYKLNNQITQPELRVIDDDGANLGVMSRAEAIKLSFEKGLDLVLINAVSQPPIAKITSFDKFRYQQEKEQKKLSAAHKGGDLKQVRITYRAAENDLRRQALMASKFLEEGHKVEIMIALRGREKSGQMRQWVHDKMQLFLSMMTVEYKITSDEKFGGRGIAMQIAKK